MMEQKPAKPAFLEGLAKTRQVFFGRIANLVGASELTSEESWDELEALLIQADLGLETATHVVESLRKRVQSEGLTTRTQLYEATRSTLENLLPPPQPLNIDQQRGLNVVLVVGVNGSGKTTSIAKLAEKYHNAGWLVMLAAADTFRAAAIDQLKAWGQRVQVPVIAGAPEGDPGAVVFDAVQAARARGTQLLLVDTAGRLHTRFNLMEELKKVRKVIEKNAPEAPHEVLIVLDGTTGQNALAQAAHFKEAVGVSGAIITKLDGTAKGGMIFAVEHELGIPVRFIGVGEGAADLLEFDAKTFVESLIVG